MNKAFLTFISLIGLCARVYSQDFEYGKVTEQDLDMKKYAKDTSAHAVVLKEYGNSYISSADGLPLEHEYHVRIKIFDSKAFDEQGNIKIQLYKNDKENFETAYDIKATTFFKNADGLMLSTELDRKNIFNENEDKHHELVKFAMPNLTNGCVIEYSYKIRIPIDSYFTEFRPWVFQSDIPKIYSEYEVHIPAVFNYNVSLRGTNKLSKNTADLDRECFSYYGTKADCSKITYAMSDIPAFVEEEDMTAPRNFLSAVYFELQDYTDLQNGNKRHITKEWKDIDYTFKHEDFFGGQLKRQSLMRDRVQPVIVGKTDTLEKAKAVYTYIQKTIKWDGFSSIGSDDGIRSALDKHSGSAGDINLALVTALNAAGINTEAVLLSTRRHGLINRLYPGVNDFNYVIAKANIGSKTYLLDATEPMLPFGLLPMRCINDQGRVMSLDKPSYWIDLTASQRNGRTNMVELTLQEDGKLKGTFVHYSSGYEAYEKRLAIKKFNSLDEYVEDLDSKMPKIKIDKYNIENLDTLEAPLAEKYDVEINAFDNLNHDRITLNPFFLDKMLENPFKLAERNYPVDLGAASDDRTVLVLHLPSNFVLESAPQPVSIGLPNQGGKFITAVVNNETSITFSHVIQLSRPTYSPQEYPYLKELYNKIVQSEKVDLVFHKKS